jgi:hypothetical protein
MKVFVVDGKVIKSSLQRAEGKKKKKIVASFFQYSMLKTLKAMQTTY